MTTRCFIVGAQRCGTTYLYHVLNAHPAIEMAQPMRPEPKFFLQDALYRRGLDFYQRTFFSGTPGATVQGEKSTSYMDSAVAAQRLAEAFPQARLIFLLREPIARAISHYWFSVQHGVETLPMAEAFLREAERRQQFDPQRTSVSPYAYLRRGCYIEELLMYERHFSREQMHILLAEECIGQVQPLQQLYAFLGVDASFVPPSLHQRVNARMEYAAVPAGTPTSYATLPAHVRTHLRAVFAAPNARLAEYLQRDLQLWHHE